MDWDARYRNEDTPWCKGRPHPMLRALLDRATPPEFTGRVVVPGCGRGWDLLAIAEARPGARVLGIDLSNTALNEVAEHIRGHPRVELMVGDFLDSDTLANLAEEVELIWEHTCFCAIDPSKRAAYVESATAMLMPGAILAGVFFLDLNDEGSGPPWNCPLPELRRLFGEAFEIECCEPVGNTFVGRHGEERAVLMRRLG